MTEGEFDACVERALAEIPKQFRSYLEEVAFIIQDHPTAEQREQFGIQPGEPDPLGFYDGIPLGERSSFDGPVPHQDCVYIFRDPLLAFCDEDPQALEREIRITVIHEIAHHFGFDDDEVDELGYG